MFLQEVIASQHNLAEILGNISGNIVQQTQSSFFSQTALHSGR